MANTAVKAESTAQQLFSLTLKDGDVIKADGKFRGLKATRNLIHGVDLPDYDLNLAISVKWDFVTGQYGTGDFSATLLGTIDGKAIRLGSDEGTIDVTRLDSNNIKGNYRVNFSSDNNTWVATGEFELHHD
ncbi:hypothetical protein ACIPZ5_26105 [Pseudomonas sp. NPDC089428]|uniref:hypothetical protein n=1 Tax=Pseudomonas sp. NPDC089428 TaxID=3364467 RepID=UPI0038208EBD